MPLEAEMATLCIDGGKSQDASGDVLGALTGDMGLDGADIGKITVHPAHVYVAIRRRLRIRHGSSCKTGKLKAKPAGSDC